MSYFRIESSGTLCSLDIFADQPADEAMIYIGTSRACSVAVLLLEGPQATRQAGVSEAIGTFRSDYDYEYHF